MALILAIEPDKKQASTVRALARGSLHAQILIAESTARGVQELNGRVPDLILTSLLLSSKDEAALDEHLRGLDTEGHRVPTLVIPVLAAVSRGSKSGGLLKRLKKRRKTTGTEACDPATFAAQITEYLDHAAAERALDEDEDDDELPIAARPAQAPEPVDETPEPQRYVAPMPVGRILFATSDVTAINAAPSAAPAPAERRRLGGSWPEAVPEAPAVAEPLDLTAFVQELEVAVSAYAKTTTIELDPIAPRAEPAAGAMTLYAWPTLEGLPAGTDWDIAEPGDPDYAVLAAFFEAFDAPTVDRALADVDETTPAIAEPASPSRAVEHDSWISLSMRTWYHWPPIEGVESLDVFATIESDPVPTLEIDAALIPPHVVQAEAIAFDVPAMPPATQWLEVLTAIRRDIQELRAEHRAGLLAEGDQSAEHPRDRANSSAGHTPTFAGEGTSPVKVGTAVERSKARKPQAPPAPPARMRKRKMPPKQDEWGFFDPDQCGFSALLAKLEEIEGDEPPPTPARS